MRGRLAQAISRYVSCGMVKAYLILVRGPADPWLQPRVSPPSSRPMWPIGAYHDENNNSSPDTDFIRLLDQGSRCRIGIRAAISRPRFSRRCLCCRRRRRPRDASHQILVGQLGNRDWYLLSERRSRWPGRSAGYRPVPTNRARQKARQPASPRPRTTSSNPVPSSRESANFYSLSDTSTRMSFQA